MDTYTRTRKSEWTGEYVHEEFIDLPINPNEYYAHCIHKFDAKGRPYTSAKLHYGKDGVHNGYMIEYKDKPGYPNIWSHSWKDLLPPFIDHKRLPPEVGEVAR